MHIIVVTKLSLTFLLWKQTVCRVEFLKSNIQTPHTYRPKCSACNRTIRSPGVSYLSTNLLRILLSIEQCKRVAANATICISCRSRYDRWKQLTMDDFDQLDTIDSSYVQVDDEAYGKNDIVVLILFEYSI